MAGILDSKSRVMDTIITSAGRKQAAAGDLQIKFVSFVDRQVSYSTGSDGVIEDPGNRIYFEAYSDDNDTIIFENDSDGNLKPFETSQFSIIDGEPRYLTGSDYSPLTGPGEFY